VGWVERSGTQHGPILRLFEQLINYFRLNFINFCSHHKAFNLRSAAWHLALSLRVFSTWEMKRLFIFKRPIGKDILEEQEIEKQ
jgi:hypothetical protein